MSGGITKISPESIISEISNWYVEAKSPYNDGWTQQHYQGQIDKVKQYLSRSEMSKEDQEIEIEKQRWVCRECNKSTFELDYDYIIAPDLCLACGIEQMK